MRIDPDFAPPPGRPPCQEKPFPRQAADPARPAKLQQGWALAPEKDPIDYDDGAWM